MQHFLARCRCQKAGGQQRIAVSPENILYKPGPILRAPGETGLGQRPRRRENSIFFASRFCSGDFRQAVPKDCFEPRQIYRNL